MQDVVPLFSMLSRHFVSFIFCYACSDSLLLTPLCCDDIHDVTPHDSALAGCDMKKAFYGLKQAPRAWYDTLSRFLLNNKFSKDRMADENVSALTRTDEQLVPVKARLPIGKSNLLMDLQKKQKNLIFLSSVDILQNINFFSAFTALANVPSIYIQSF
nr:retrovirus-related Pol polyprotein from transposon TNT 1-94 [Tanacetum cinerariifolium]